MGVKFSDLEMAFMFVSMDQIGMHSANVDRETGHIFHTSEIGDSDELPEDIFENDRYLAIPHKNDLDLGKALVLDFTADRLAEELDRGEAIFRKKGAYSRSKDLLEEQVFWTSGTLSRRNGRGRRCRSGAGKWSWR
jgi:hypothetical protein